MKKTVGFGDTHGQVIYVVRLQAGRPPSGTIINRCEPVVVVKSSHSEPDLKGMSHGCQAAGATDTGTDFEVGVLLLFATLPSGTRTFASGK